MTRALPLLLALGVGCMPDDYDGTPYDPADWQTAEGGTGGALTVDTAVPADAPAIVGTWVSEGDDISPLFAGPPFEYQRITAAFDADGAYTVESVDGAGAVYAIAGTFTVDEAVVPHRVSLAQSSPYEAEAEGIWAVADGALTYEVVQTVPDYGFTPPTPDGGFGSTAGSGLAPGDNIQVYRR